MVDIVVIVHQGVPHPATGKYRHVLRPTLPPSHLSPALTWPLHPPAPRSPNIRSLKGYLRDLLVAFVSRDLHCAATFCRKFYW